MTMSLIIISASFVMLALGIVLGFQGIRLRRQVRQREERLRWILEQIDRAVGQLSRGEEDEALAALQTLSMLGGQRSFGYLELARRRWQGNKRVLGYVEEAADRLTPRLESQRVESEAALCREA